MNAPLVQGTEGNFLLVGDDWRCSHCASIAIVGDTDPRWILVHCQTCGNNALVQRSVTAREKGET